MEEGKLTPEEFIAAGDLLVAKCGQWTWSAADPKYAVNYLPADKQFLISRNVKCKSRVSQLEQRAASQRTVSLKIDGDNDEWTSLEDSSAPTVEGEIEAPKLSEKIPTLEETLAKEKADDSEEIMDMDDLDDDIVAEVDPATAPSNDDIVKTRTYDISIVYDNYYRTPRIWLYGYDENHKPLKSQDIFDDISSNYAKKTVTIDNHPCTGVSQAYIHPCRHAEVMQKIMQRLVQQGKTVTADIYLILFLKFISSVIPTIEYDYTMEMDRWYEI